VAVTIRYARIDGETQGPLPTTKLPRLIHAGRVVCPNSGIDGPASIAIRAGRILAVGPHVSGPATDEFDFPHALVLPGLVDLHAHPALEGSVHGIDPDRELLPRGTTTVMSQGDAGAANWQRFRQTTSAVCRCRVKLAINLARQGESRRDPCFADIRNADVDDCIAAIEAGGDLIPAVAVDINNLDPHRTDPAEVIRRGVAVAERTHRRILFGMRSPRDISFAEQLAQLRPGDIVTYCYRSRPHCIMEKGRVHPAIRDARERGILFDLGHGKGSFDFEVAEAALADGFPPDTISTDAHRLHLGDRPPHDLPRTMSKLVAAGMAEEDVFAAVTARPARIMGLENDVGCLRPGACADLAVLRWNERAAPLADVYGRTRPGGCWEPVMTFRAGEPIPPGPA